MKILMKNPIKSTRLTKLTAHFRHEAQDAGFSMYVMWYGAGLVLAILSIATN